MTRENEEQADGVPRSERAITRRAALFGAAGLASSAAGCGGDGDSSPTDTRSPTSESITGTPTERPSPTATETESDPEPLVVEDFAEDSLEGYEGATDEVSITSNAALSGEYSLNDGTNSWGDGSIYRVGDLPYEPRAGDTFRVGLYVRDYDRDDFPFWAGFHWAVDEEYGIENLNGEFEPANCYSFSFDVRDNWTEFEHGDFKFTVQTTEGQWTHRAKRMKVPLDRPFPKGEWVEIEVDWGADGRMELTCLTEAGNAFASISGEGIDDHETGGIGFRPGGSRGHVNYWDYVRIIDRP